MRKLIILLIAALLLGGCRELTVTDFYNIARQALGWAAVRTPNDEYRKLQKVSRALLIYTQNRYLPPEYRFKCKNDRGVMSVYQGCVSAWMWFDKFGYGDMHDISHYSDVLPTMTDDCQTVVEAEMVDYYPWQIEVL